MAEVLNACRALWLICTQTAATDVGHLRWFFYGGSFNDRTSTCNDHAAFASGCGPYLVRMIHGARARPIQKDGTLQRFLLGGLGPAAVGRPAVETSVVCIGVGSCVLPNVPAEARARLQRCSRLTSPMIRLLRGVCQHPSPLMSRGGLTLWLLQLAP